MINFLKKYYREIIQILLLVITCFLLYDRFTPVEDRSKLVDYKLNQIDIKIGELKEKQKTLNDSIISYQKSIELIDTKLSDLKVERKTINNYYDEKKTTITQMDKKQVDSTLRKRYNY